jgi:threonine dehydratase
VNVAAAAAAEEVTLADIEAARVRISDRIRPTPMLRKEQLSTLFGVPMYLKGEHLQRTGSFKLRGALNLVSQLDEPTRARGVAAASAGNHAQGVAVAAAEHGVRARIWMPADASLSKVEATRSYGAEVVLEGEHLTAALAAAQAWAEESGALFVHPFDDPRIVAGAGTVGLEIAEQVPDVATVVVPIGGGGLFSGVAIALRGVLPGCRLVGVQAAACESVAASLAAGEPTIVEARPTMADGIAVKQPGVAALRVIQRCMDELVTVDDDDLGSAILWLMERGKQVVEGAGAASLAAVLSGKLDVSGPTVCLLSGGNIDPMSLMPVIRHGLTTVGRFARISTTVADRPGQLSGLLALLARARVNILSVEHRREGEALHVGETRIELTMGTRNRDHLDEVLSLLAGAGYDVRVG